jgi:hypothetical protein
MSEQARNVLAEALRLPLEERAEVVTELLRSLEHEESRLSAEEIERLWAEEIERRALRAVRGESLSRDAEAVLGAIETKLTRR